MPCFEAHDLPAAIRRDFDGVGENPPADLTATTKLASRQLGEPICFMREIFSNPLTPVQRDGLRAESWQGWNHSRGRDTAGTLRPRKPLRPSNGEGAEDGIDWVTGSTESQQRGWAGGLGLQESKEESASPFKDQAQTGTVSTDLSTSKGSPKFKGRGNRFPLLLRGKA